MNDIILGNLAKVQETEYLFAHKSFDMEDCSNNISNEGAYSAPTDTRIDIITLFKGFYSLQMLEAIAQSDEFLRSHVRWREDFNHLKSWYYKTLARMIYDYSVLSCFGELRHTNECCERTVKSSYFKNYWTENRDYFVRQTTIPYTARSIIHMSQILFNNYAWKSGYGGEAWGYIADAQDLYIEGQEAVYIDHCVDLEHNNGTYFNKDLIFWVNENYGSIKHYLDFKFKAEPEELLETCPIREIQELILRANTLGIIPTLDSHFHFSQIKRTQCVYRPSTDLHIFFPKPKNGYENLGVIDLMKIYKPFQFGREVLTKHDITCSTRWDGNNEEQNSDEY